MGQSLVGGGDAWLFYDVLTVLYDALSSLGTVVDAVFKPPYRPPGAALAAGASGSQTQAAAPEAAPDCRVSEAA